MTGVGRSYTYCVFGSGPPFASGRFFASIRSADAVGTLFDPALPCPLPVMRHAAAGSLSNFRMRSLDLLSCSAVPRTVIAEMPEVGTKYRLPRVRRYGSMMSAACCGERHESGIVSVSNVDVPGPLLRIAGRTSVAALNQIVTKSAAPLIITTTRPTRRRCAVVTAVSARVIGLLIGGRLLSTLAALYSLSRRSVVRREQSGQVAQCCITAESPDISLSEPVASSERHSSQVIGTARGSSGVLRAGSLE